MTPSSRFFLCLVAVSLIEGKACATGMQTITMPPIPPAPPKITIDGKLDEWRSISGVTQNPLDRLVNSGGDPAVEAILVDPLSATFKSCYDSDALYVAVELKDRKPGTNTTPAGDAAHWANGGEGFELHLLTDRVLHLACWPAPGGLSVMARYDDQKDWRDVSKSVTAAGAVEADGKTYAEELRIPWAAVTAAGKLPGDGKVEMGIDFAWNAIPPSFVENLHKALWTTANWAQGTGSSFLTARPDLISKGYIPNPGDWGSMIFGQAPNGDQAIRGPNGNTSLSSFAVAAARSENPPATDGSLGGWDDSLFQTATYLGAFWGDRFTCRVAAQSDADNLYLAAHFASPGPVNLMAESTQGGFNGGDAFQVRLSNGTKKVSLCSWYDTRAGKPALTADGNDLPSPFLLKQGAQEGFKPDGKGGYVETLALPWRVLLGKAPAAGSEIKATLQFWFADFTNRYSTHAVTTLERRPALSVAYKMPADGQLTLGLYDKEGKLLKWLAQDDYRYAGANQEAWDGLDQYGNPVPAGSYQLKGLYHAPITTDYQMSVGNPGNPPWPTPDGKGDWLADESNPQAAATDGKWVYLASPSAEKGFWLIAVDENGRRQWGIPGSPDNPRCVSLSVDGDYLYALYSGPVTTTTARVYKDKSGAIGRDVLVCYDKNTGKAARFTVATPRLRIATWPYREEIAWLDVLRNNKSYNPAVYGGQPRYAATDVGESTNALGMAAVGDKVYVSSCYDNKITVFDAATGQPTGAQIALDAPAGLYALDANTLLAVSGKQVVKIDLTNGSTTPFITTGLSAPFNITTDKAGTIYVSDWGSSFQVKAFNSKGQFLHAVGKEGGRPWVGKWDASGMLVPRGIAVTDEGKLWVAEDDGSPPRISVWNAQTGDFLKEYIGPTPYGGGTYFAVDPKDPTLVHTEGTTFKVDYAKKTYSPVSVDFRRQNRDDPFSPNGHGSASGHTEIRYHDGNEYMITGASPNMFSIMIRKGDVYRPVAAFGGLGRATPLTVDSWDSDLGHHGYPGYYPAFFEEHNGENYSWTDTNGDNLVQPDEMHWVKPVNAPYQEGTQPPLFGSYWGLTALAPDWSVVTVGSFRDKTAIFRVPLKGWTPAGAPIYDVADAKPIAFETPNPGVENVYVTKDSRIILTCGYEGGLNPDAFVCYDMNGRRLWSIARPPKPWDSPSPLEPKHVHANGTVYDFDIPKLGDVFCTWLWHGAERPYLITTDGLYVGTMLENTFLGPKAMWGESYSYFFQKPDGTPYLVNGASQAEHFLQIKGLEAGATGRFSGTYDLDDNDVKLAASMRQIPEEKAAPKPVLAVTWLTNAPAIDGDLSDWKLGAGVTLDGGKGRTADVALGRDADNLYLAYQVHEANPMRNGGSDWQTLFITGDCVDVMLQTDPKADPNRRAAAAGDERLLFSEFQGQPIAVLYRPSVPGATSPVRLNTAAFDQIVKLDGAKVAIKRDAAQGFYTVEASVPLKDLNLDPKATEDLRGDVGVVFADESGQSRSLRLYYYNHHTELVNDLPTEATLQPADWGKIAMPLGPNLIQNGGFEDPFVDSKDDMDKGWYVSDTHNGADATLSSESPYSGHQSLLLESMIPVTFAPEAYNNPDYSAFLKTANGGKGQASAEVRQRVTVTAGHQYSLRLQFRSQDYPHASSVPGHPRGWVGFGVRLEWIYPPPRPENAELRLAIADMYTIGGALGPTPDWYTIYNIRRGYWGPATPYTAPDGAIAVDLVLSMRSQMDARPKIFFDDVELVDVTPGVAIN